MRTEIILPAMGEGIIEAEITRWLVKEGDFVEADSAVVEIATDKVDSEVPAPVSGYIRKILLNEGEIAKIGQVIALLGDEKLRDSEVQEEIPELIAGETSMPADSVAEDAPAGFRAETLAFLSPLVKNTLKEHNIPFSELEKILGSGADGRITRSDVLNYIKNRNPVLSADAAQINHPVQKPVLSKEQIYGAGGSRVEEMSRIRKKIADHMVYSKMVAPHVTSFMEADVTDLIHWRNSVKEEFQNKYGQKLTITALIIEAVASTLREFPDINVSVDGYNIIRKSRINIGMATALPDGNLIVPVVKEADTINLHGLAKQVNTLAHRARNNTLRPDETTEGTFTITNLANFENLAGTPVINQPEVAILAVGTIKKRVEVVELPDGDAIGIRHMMILSLAYDHRVVDGGLGGMFLKRICEKLEKFNSKRNI